MEKCLVFYSSIEDLRIHEQLSKQLKKLGFEFSWNLYHGSNKPQEELSAMINNQNVEAIILISDLPEIVSIASCLKKKVYCFNHELNVFVRK